MTAPADNLRIDGLRLWESLMAMAKVGPGLRGGNNRQALTDADREGRDLFRSWCEGAGMKVAVDTMGSIFARREGTDPTLAPVMVGSHLDTQPTGGRYDGVLGVLAGLEIVRTLDDLGIRTRRPIEVVNWTNEEGTRFAPAMLASGVFAGVHDEAWAHARQDASGRSFGDELRRIGYLGEAPAGRRRIHAYYELHIEQGPILEDEDIDIGVVTHGQGLKWLQVSLTGRESHTGSTPMPKRRNAALGMARVMELVDEVAWRHAPHAVGAVGHVEIFPNSRNVIPGRAVFTIDIRSPRQEVLDDMDDRICAGIVEIADAIGLGAQVEQVGHFDPVAFDQSCIRTIRAAADRLGYSHRDIVSGAGHDACWINRVAPTAMVMCPCVGGLSHNEDEEITREWATAGAEVLFHAVVETAEIVE
ncbi:Zn-dependent hydrolase [Lutibaculum baratangense]|uniref:Beta-ureidopropionase n=1 Tax=Lutibaculum baratangense AMV1 TaxID=631454 RepID=V4T783_9HYPH|nr:Zn-dependent hydrolase [Lutibaculum baratangense]ESR22478.1 Beta-ureidopropionase [Lutibaculum baratangense AMV1]